MLYIYIYYDLMCYRSNVKRNLHLRQDTMMSTHRLTMARSGSPALGRPASLGPAGGTAKDAAV